MSILKSNKPINSPGYFRIFGTVDGKPSAVYLPPTDEEGNYPSPKAMKADLARRRRMAMANAQKGIFDPV